MDAMEKRHAEAIAAEHRRYEQALATMKEQVQNATNQMLKERQAELQQSNSTNMKMIVDPLKESIAKMESALKENKSTQETSTEAIKEKIATLVSTTMKVSDSAERLSNALTAENKTQKQGVNDKSGYSTKWTLPTKGSFATMRNVWNVTGKIENITNKP